MTKVVISHSGIVVCEITPENPVVRLTCEDTKMTDDIDIELIITPDE